MKRILFCAFVLAFAFNPARSQVSVIGELSHDKEVRAGETYEGMIAVRNDTEEPQEVKVYQTDYTFFSNGSNNYGEPGTTPRSNAKWISFRPSYLTVPAHATSSINYTVVVPAETAEQKLVGSFWSMLMIEGIGKGSAESTAKKDPTKTQMGIQQTVRYGIQIASHIAQTGTKKINFVDTKLVAKDDGKHFLQVDVENTGDVWMRPEMYVEVFDDKGNSKGRFPGIRYRLYPGTSVRQSIDLSSLEKGAYKALIVVDSGGDDVYGAEFNLKF